jgi:regulator of protease activity HflC (stomatin/prohibitin superfamily)
MTTSQAVADIDVAMPQAPVSERTMQGAPGVVCLFLSTGVFVLGLVLDILAGSLHGGNATALWLPGAVLMVVSGFAYGGLTAVSPGEARVISLFGRYVGTIRVTGLRWVNPFSKRQKVSTRVRNHETAILKVNDADGNPIEMAAVVVWQVDDTAKAVYGVDNFVAFVSIQTETAVRHVAGSYPYDARGTEHLSLRENAEEITSRLSAEISARVTAAGVKVIESRITRLSYAPEIAQAMLRRQQAEAVVAARQRLVEGAVGMVRMALDSLAEQQLVDLDDERKASMVSNLLVVLCSEQATQPVVNTGSLYQ